MILDAFIALCAILVEALAAILAAVFIPLANLVLLAIEVIGELFVAGFTLGRIERKKGEFSVLSSRISGYIILGLLAGAIAWFLVLPAIMNRNVALIAADGHSLPFAAVIIQTSDGKSHKRTDKAGNVSIPRFATESLTIKDPRYVAKTWVRSELQPELTVQRTVLGSGLDSIADRFLKPDRK